MIVVSDTSPITNLIQIHQLAILRKLFYDVVITPAVYAELCALPEQKSILAEENWIKVIKLPEENLVKGLEGKLDRGEAESIALAIYLQADYLLIDEIKGREIAEKLGIRIVGLVGILIKAKAEAIIPAVKPLLNELITKAGFFIHTNLYQKVLEITKENN